MYNPTMRLLTILERLQSRAEVSTQELTDLLEVDERTVRRYIMMLRDMGIPIDSERGRYGGYTLQPGFRIPPLMFTGGEVTAVMLGLMLLNEMTTEPLPDIQSAIDKLQRVLPDELQRTVDALHNNLILNDLSTGIDSFEDDYVNQVTTAADNQNCVLIRYESASGEETERLISPYGVVLYNGRWYIPAYCHLRDDTRVFRMDRILDIQPTRQHFTRPADFDPQDFVLTSLASQSNGVNYEILFDAPLVTVRELIPRTVGKLKKSGSKTILSCNTDDPDWLARILAPIELPYTVLANDELRTAIRELAAEMVRKTKK